MPVRPESRKLVSEMSTISSQVAADSGAEGIKSFAVPFHPMDAWKSETMRSAWAFDMPSVESHLRFTAFVIFEHHVRSAGMQSLSVPFFA
jgi:hypothetical protein